MSSQSPSLLQWLENTNNLPLSCSHSCSVLATIGNVAMGHLSVVSSYQVYMYLYNDFFKETKKRVLPLLLSLSEDSNPSIKVCTCVHFWLVTIYKLHVTINRLPFSFTSQSSAIRTLGIFSKYSSQCFNDTFMLDVCDSITKGLVNEAVAVRIQASWSIGNLTDSLVHEEGWKDKICINKYGSLSESVVVAMGDIEKVCILRNYLNLCFFIKVKVNAFRAAGNLLHVLTDESIN